MTVDVETMIETGDEEELFRLWRTAGERAMWQRAIEQARAAGKPTTNIAVLERALAQLPEITPLAALRANKRLVELLMGRRWFVMQAAREGHTSWAEIGEALGMSRQAAWEWYDRNIGLQERYVGTLHDAARAQAALGERPAPDAQEAAE